ncbi:hypothetical protein KAT73_00475 [candidate division WOR-3 bacterium]|nr:hypothetical protein [candidate division WOR-3 bacterium]
MVLPIIILLLLNQTSQAEQLLKKGDIAKLKENCSGLEDESFFLGEANFFEKDFESAITQYSKLPASSKYTNDALLRTLIIKELENEPLEFYVDAELEIRRGNNKKAAEFIREGIAMDSSTYSYAAILLSMVYEAKNDIALAIQVLLDAVDLRPNDLFAPYILKKAFFLYKVMEMYNEAMDIYERISIYYPDSPILPVIKERIEHISQ